MMLNLLSAGWMAWVQLTAISTPDVIYPENVVVGGTVAGSLHLSSGSVTKVDILSGEEPFIQFARSSLSGWRFSQDTKDPSVLVVVHFRHRNLYDVGSSSRPLKPRRQEQSLPFPTALKEPVYPLNYVGRGCVIMKLRVGADGSVTQVDALRGPGPLTEASVRAVNAWRFTPARDAQGRNTSSEIYVVCVFHEPILAPQPP